MITQIALKNLTKRKKRSWLTMLGIFIGIAAIVSLISLGQGLQVAINEQFEKIGGDKIIITSKGIGAPGVDQVRNLTEHDKKIIKQTKDVKIVAAQKMRAARVKFDKEMNPAFIMSIPSAQDEADLLISLSSLETTEGRIIRTQDSGKITIGYDYTQKLFEKPVKIGDKLEIENKTFKVVGILKKTGDPGTDPSILMNEKDIDEITGNKDNYNYMVAQALGDPETVANDVEKTLRKDRGEKEGQEDFDVQTSGQIIESFNSILSIIQVVIVGVAAISLLVGAIGIMNTMYTSILERTREIGVMKAIGAKNSHILQIFLTESAVLGGIGGIIGIAIGMSISKTVEIVVKQVWGTELIRAYFPIWMIIVTFVFAVILGGLSGAVPAYRASKLKPVDALREE